MRPRDPIGRFALLVAAFVLTRVALLVLTRSPELYPQQNDPFDIGVFAGWGAAFSGEGDTAPLRDGPWEYPAGAAAVIVAPALVRGAPYVLGFVGQMVLWDLAILLVLAVLGLRRGSLGGAWLWIAVVPLLGPVALARFDLVPTALAVGGIAVATVAPGLAGVLLGAGAVVKLWPALVLGLVLLLVRGRLRALAGALVVGVGTLGSVIAYGGGGQLLSFLTYQQDRGLQVESVPALPLMLARAYGDERVSISFAFGASQVDGPWGPALLRVADLGLVAVVLMVGALALRARRRGADPFTAVVSLAALLMAGVLIFDKVLSPQYPLWLAGLICLGLCRPGSPLEPTVAPLVGLLALTQLVYPLRYADFVELAAVRPALLLAARDVLLVVVFAVLLRACWRLTGVVAAPAEAPGEPAAVHRLAG